MTQPTQNKLNPAPTNMGPYWLRKWRITIATFRGIGVTVESSGTSPARDGKELHVLFSADMSIARGYQDAAITIYNLAPDTETDLLQNGAALKLEAGYEGGAFGVIFSGPIRQAIRGKDNGTDYWLKLICMDGFSELYAGICNFTLVAGQTQQQIAQMVARSSNYPFDIKVDDLGSQKTQRARTVFGQPGVILRQLAQNNNASFFVNQGVGYLTKLSKAPTGNIPNLNAQSGMIGMPQQTDDGVQVKSLINPNFRLGEWLKLDNHSVIIAELEFGVPQTTLDQDGIYRIVGIHVIGDTRGNDWYFEMACVSQAGGIPDALKDPNQYGM